MIPDKSLDAFLDAIRKNQNAVRSGMRDEYRIIHRVATCFAFATPTLSDAKPELAAHMFLRSHYAYKTSASLILAGLFVESHVMMRSCLEYSGYGLLITSHPGSQVTFINRHDSEASKKAHKRRFSAESIRQTLKSVDRALTVEFNDVYDRCIDYGAHPNPNGMFNSMTVEKQDGCVSAITSFAIVNDPLTIKFAMNNLIQVGLLSLRIFAKGFSQKFDALGINGEIKALLDMAY